MRIAYENIIDDLTASNITALTTTTGYSVINTQDQRLTTVWKSTSATIQSVIFTLDTFPEYPDGTAIYKQSPIVAVTGFITDATAGTLIYSDGQLHLAAAANNTLYRLISAYAANSTLRVRVKTSASQLRAIYWNGSVNALTAYQAITPNVWTILSFTLPDALAAANKPYGLYIVGATDTADISDWYLGDGSYAAGWPVDNSGNGNDGSACTGVTPVAGISGNGLSWDGINDGITIPSGLPAGDITISLWMKAVKAGTTQVLFFQEGGDHRQIYTDNNNIICFSSRRSNGTTEIVSTIPAASWTASVWNHIVGVQSGLTLSIYLNGALIDTDTFADIYTSFSADGYLGHNATAAWYAGSMGEFKVYNRALSVGEISNLYNHTPWLNEKSGFCVDYTLNKNLKVSMAALMGYNFLPGSQVKIQGSNWNEWSDPEVNEIMIVNENMILKFFTDTYCYKYWRFYFTGQGSLEIGRLWLGEYITIDPSSLLDFTVAKKRSDLVTHNTHRQKFAIPGVTWRQFGLVFPPSNENSIYQIATLYDEVGNHSSFIFCNFDTIRDYVLVEPCYVSIKGEVGFDHTERMKFTYSLNMEEEL